MDADLKHGLDACISIAILQTINRPDFAFPIEIVPCEDALIRIGGTAEDWAVSPSEFMNISRVTHLIRVYYRECEYIAASIAAMEMHGGRRIVAVRFMDSSISPCSINVGVTP